MENNMELPWKSKNEPTIWLCSPTHGIREDSNLKGHMHPKLRAALFTVAKTWKQSICLLTDEWIKKMWCTHTHIHIYIFVYVYDANGIIWQIMQMALFDSFICLRLLRHIKESNNAICNKMNVPRDYHTNWSKSDKDKYPISLIFGI